MRRLNAVDLTQLGDEVSRQLEQHRAGTDRTVARERIWRRLQHVELGSHFRFFSQPKVVTGFALAAAAGVALAVLVGTGAVGESTQIDRAFHASAGEVQQHRLPDGSALTLASGARGRLTTEGDRDVHFELNEGRVSFEVKPESHKRWRIQAGLYQVNVIGTIFAVDHSPKEQRTSVRVKRGIVQVTGPRLSSAVRLLAGDELVGTADRVEVVRANSADEVKTEPEAKSEQAPAPSDSAEQAAHGSGAAKSHKIDFRTYYSRGEYKAALKAIERDGVAQLLQGLDRDGLWALSDAARLAGNPGVAERGWRALRARFAGSTEAARAAFMLGRAADQRGQAGLAEQNLKAYLQERPAGIHASDAVGRLMHLYRKAGRLPEARQMAHRYLELAPNGAYRELALSLRSP